MINLTATTDKLSVITSAAVTTDAHTSWVDYNSTTVTPGRTNAAITTATTTDISGSPGASTQRNVKTINIANKHASSSQTVTVQFDQNGTLFVLYTTTLGAGEELQYIDGDGWAVYDSSGNRKIISPPTQNLIVKALLSDKTNGGTTAAAITGIDQVVGVGTWHFKYAIIYRSDTTTTGVKFGVDHTGTVSFFVYNGYYIDNNALAATAAADQDAVATTAQIVGGYAARAKAGATAPFITASVDTINVDMLFIIEGIAVVTASGTLQLYHASEAASTTTVKAGSGLYLIKIG
jgi:hypothetical protein